VNFKSSIVFCAGNDIQPQQKTYSCYFYSYTRIRCFKLHLLLVFQSFCDKINPYLHQAIPFTFE